MNTEQRVTRDGTKEFPLVVLHLEDDRHDAALARATLSREGIHAEFIQADGRDDFMAALEQNEIDLILADYSLPSFDGLTALAVARERCPAVPFILVSGHLGEELAIESLKSGARDYVLKHRMSRLVPAVRRAIREAAERQQRSRAEEALRQSEARLRESNKNLRSLGAKLSWMEELEKRRLARELHDQVGQALTALGLNLSLVRDQLPHSQGPLAARIDDAVEMVVDITQKIRSVMSELRPPVLDDFGLPAALRWYCGEAARRTGVAIDLAGKDLPARLPLETETGLFRIAQEALTNAIKHAQVTHVSVRLDATPTGLRLTISDDGLGMNLEAPSTADGVSGWGLIGMEERAIGIGGVFRVESQPGNGTSVIVEVEGRGEGIHDSPR